LEDKEKIETNDELNGWIERLSHKKAVYLELKAIYGTDCKDEKKLDELEYLRKEMDCLKKLIIMRLINSDIINEIIEIC